MHEREKTSKRKYSKAKLVKQTKKPEVEKEEKKQEVPPTRLLGMYLG